MAIRVIVCVLRMIAMWCVKDTLQFGSSDYRIRFNILQPEKSLSLHTFIGFDMLRTVLIVGIGSLFLITGFCGSFTTFSTFARESLAMLQAHNIAGFSAYAAVSIIAGIALAAFGYWLVR